MKRIKDFSTLEDGSYYVVSWEFGKSFFKIIDHNKGSCGYSVYVSHITVDDTNNMYDSYIFDDKFHKIYKFDDKDEFEREMVIETI